MVDHQLSDLAIQNVSLPTCERSGCCNRGLKSALVQAPLGYSTTCATAPVMTSCCFESKPSRPTPNWAMVADFAAAEHEERLALIKSVAKQPGQAATKSADVVAGPARMEAKRVKATVVTDPGPTSNPNDQANSGDCPGGQSALAGTVTRADFV